MLSIERLSAGYGGTDVLHDVSLSVGEEECVAVLGANGAGKTTLLRAASGLLGATAGTLTLDGQDITGQPTHTICRAGLVHVPEGRKLFPGMTVLDNLRLGAMPGEPMRRCAETLHEMFARFPILANRRTQLAGTLSGGEQQQLAIARGLMGRPKLLLLDEPTLGLSPLLADTILELVTELHQDGLSVLLVSQEVVSALEIAQRAYVIENGSCEIHGVAAELERDHDLRAAYLGL